MLRRTQKEATSLIYFFQTRTIRWELGVPPKTLKNRDVFYRAYMDVFTACLGRNTQLPANPGKVNSLRPVPTKRRTTGYAQDVRYFAKEHMDVRREAFQVCTACKIPGLSTTRQGWPCSVSQGKLPASRLGSCGFFQNTLISLSRNTRLNSRLKPVACSWSIRYTARAKFNQTR